MRGVSATYSAPSRNATPFGTSSPHAIVSTSSAVPSESRSIRAYTVPSPRLPTNTVPRSPSASERHYNCPVPQLRRCRRAVVVAALALAASAPPARAQAPSNKLDPLLRPLLDPAVVAQIERAPRIEAVGAALSRPLSQTVVLRRE